MAIAWAIFLVLVGWICPGLCRMFVATCNMGWYVWIKGSVSSLVLYTSSTARGTGIRPPSTIPAIAGPALEFCAASSASITSARSPLVIFNGAAVLSRSEWYSSLRKMLRRCSTDSVAMTTRLIAVSATDDEARS